MTPYQTAAELHNAAGMPYTFGETLEAHAFKGYVFITPHLFLLGRRVDPDWPDDKLLEPHMIAPDGLCWHLYLAAGDLREALRLMPYRLPWLSYYTKGKRRVIRLERWERLQLQ